MTVTLITSRCIGDQVGTKRRPPVIVAYVPYAFVEGPHGVRIPKFAAQQQPQPQSSTSVDSDGSEDERDRPAGDTAPPVAAREDWLVVLARAAQDKKEWVRRPGK